MNHYATNMFFNEGGRHYWFATTLLKKGYEPTIICANTRHNSEDKIEIKENNYSIRMKSAIPFVFVKVTPYLGNGLNRIKNMISFYKNLFSVTRKLVKVIGKPDVILASSVHPLTLVAGIKIAKKLNIPCICEVRDLWPESIVAYGSLRKNSLIAKLLYKGEKWIYKNADSIIMTWEGGQDYIIEQGWENDISINKISHINNGVLLEQFDENSEQYIYKDSDLDNKNNINIVYAGSIRKVNNIGLLLDAAKIIQSKGIDEIKFLIFGSGNEVVNLINRCKTENISNVIFKGRVEKKFIPSILKNADLNILHNSSTILDKYGQSQNKFFEYLAAGKGIIQTYSTGYSICKKYDCGIVVANQTKEEIANAIIDVYSDKNRIQMMGKNARSAAYNYDFNNLTNKLIKIIESV